MPMRCSENIRKACQREATHSMAEDFSQQVITLYQEFQEKNDVSIEEGQVSRALQTLVYLADQAKENDSQLNLERFEAHLQLVLCLLLVSIFASADTAYRITHAIHYFLQATPPNRWVWEDHTHATRLLGLLGSSVGSVWSVQNAHHSAKTHYQINPNRLKPYLQTVLLHQQQQTGELTDEQRIAIALHIETLDVDAFLWNLIWRLKNQRENQEIIHPKSQDNSLL